jgi:hypothetical protein
MNTIPPAKSTRRTPKTARAAATKPRAAARDDRRTPKTARAPASDARHAAKATSARAKSAPQSEKRVSHETVVIPTFLPVTLTAPRYTGRAVKSMPDALERAETRLKIAWLYHDELDLALPGGADFHARAWTALDTLRQYRAMNVPGAAARHRKAALEELATRLAILRGAVEDLTRPGDPERAIMRFDVALQPTGTLLDAAQAMIDGAVSLQEIFAALTDTAIENARVAFAQAKDADTTASANEDARTLARAARADRVQLALDVLLDSVDALRAAARTVFLPARPIVAAYFLEALEPHSPSVATVATDDESEPPTPAKPA